MSFLSVLPLSKSLNDIRQVPVGMFYLLAFSESYSSCDLTQFPSHIGVICSASCQQITCPVSRDVEQFWSRFRLQCKD